MKIAWETSVYAGNGPNQCLLCRGRFWPLKVRGNLNLLAFAYDSSGRFCGEVCRDCARSTPEQIRAHLHERIARLRSELAELEQLASEPLEAPTIEQEFRAYL